jgi:hypothetical protein
VVPDHPNEYTDESAEGFCVAVTLVLAERWCSAGGGSDTCPSVNACNSERRACAALGQHRGETQVGDAHLVTVPPFYLDILFGHRKLFGAAKRSVCSIVDAARWNYRHIRVKLAATSIEAPAFFATLIGPSV